MTVQISKIQIILRKCKILQNKQKHTFIDNLTEKQILRLSNKLFLRLTSVVISISINTLRVINHVSSI